MGTRATYGFIKDGTEKITYCQYDGYPDGLGKDVTKFIEHTTIDEMNKIFDSIILVNQNEQATDAQVEECKKWLNLNVSTGKKNDWYCLLREAQGDLFAYKDDLKYMIDSSKNGNWIEYTYIIDLDKDEFIAYSGNEIIYQEDINKIDYSWYVDCE